MGTRQELLNRMAEVVERHGEWEYDIPLPHGVWTRGNQEIPHTRLKRVVQIMSDLVGKSLGSCRIIDLGCLDGLFSIECALQGASVTGIDVREANIEKANFAKVALDLDNAEFLVADVNNVSASSHGTYDIVLCSGLLYHLNVPNVFHVIENIYAMTERLAIFDTHISLRPNTMVTYQNREYSGHIYREHSAMTVAEDMEKRRLSSYGNLESFWFSRPSLMNALSHAGYSSVYECYIPPHINFGRPGVEHRDRCTIIAIKGKALNLHTSPVANGLLEDWPEGTLDYSNPRGAFTRPSLLNRMKTFVRAGKK